MIPAISQAALLLLCARSPLPIIIGDSWSQASAPHTCGVVRGWEWEAMLCALISSALSSSTNGRPQQCMCHRPDAGQANSSENSERERREREKQETYGENTSRDRRRRHRDTDKTSTATYYRTYVAVFSDDDDGKKGTN